MNVLQLSRGIVSALVTPFTTADEVHHESLSQIVEHTLRLHSGGFYVCGSTGEGFLLSPEERQKAVETVIAATQGRAEIIVNISHMEIRQVLRLADHAAEVGATAVSALPPIFNAISPAELLAYFQTLLDRVRLPLTIYNIPHLTHLPLSENTVEALAKTPHFVGVKHSSEDTQMLMRFKRVAGGRLIVWSGRDAYYLGCLAMGADGAIGSSFQLLGDIFAEITRAFRAGDHGRALYLQERVNEVHRRLQVHGPIRSIKRCLTLLGIESGECRLPFAPLGSVADDFLRETLAMADRIRRDFEIDHSEIIPPTSTCVSNVSPPAQLEV